MDRGLTADRERRRSGVARVAAATYSTSVAAAACSLANVTVVAHLLGPRGRGDVAFVVAVATLGAHVAGGSVGEANATIGAVEAPTRPSLATNAVVLAGISGVAALGILLVLWAAVPAAAGDVGPGLLLLAVVTIPVVVLRTSLSLLIQASDGFTLTNLAWLASPAVTLVVNASLAAAGVLSTATAAAAWSGGQVLAAGVLVVWLHRHGRFGRVDAPLCRRVVAFGLRAHVGHLMSVGNYRVDQWILGATRGSRELGLYSVAVAWAELLFYVPGVLILVLRPDLARANPRAAAARLAHALRLVLLVAAGAGIALAAAAPVLCTVAFGDRFAGSVADLRLLAAGALGIATVELLRGGFVAQRKPDAASQAIAVAFVATVGLDVLLIPAHGGVGAAIATAVAYTVGGAAAVALFCRRFGVRPRQLVPRAADLRFLLRQVSAGGPLASVIGRPGRPATAARSSGR